MSANIVGYAQTDKLLDVGKCKCIGAMFVNTSGAAMTMGDLRVMGLEGAEGEGVTVACQFLNGNGGRKEGTAYMNWYEFGTKGEGTEGEDWAYGWYDEDGVNYNDTTIPAGEGLWMASQNTKYSIQNAGQVPAAPVAVQLLDVGKCKMIVNPMPAQITMGDLYVTGLEGAEGEGVTVACQFLNGNGGRKEGTAYMNWYEFGTKGEGTEGEDWAYGWYDEDGVNYNDTTVPAGEGVWMASQNTKYFINADSVL